MIGAELSRALQRLLLPVQWQKGESKYQSNKPSFSLSIHQNGKNVAVQMEQQNLNSNFLAPNFESQIMHKIEDSWTKTHQVPPKKF